MLVSLFMLVSSGKSPPSDSWNESTVHVSETWVQASHTLFSAFEYSRPCVYIFLLNFFWADYASKVHILVYFILLGGFGWSFNSLTCFLAHILCRASLVWWLSAFSSYFWGFWPLHLFFSNLLLWHCLHRSLIMRVSGPWPMRVVHPGCSLVQLTSLHLSLEF